MKITAALLALALPAAALAQDTTFDPTGEWLFRTDAVQNGEALCTEIWTFSGGDRLAVESGAERVEKRYRVETDRDGTWIVAETLSTNGQPDCMGNVAAIVTPGERRTYVIPMNSGHVLTCPPPAHTADGTPFISECYGRIIPLGEVG